MKKSITFILLFTILLQYSRADKILRNNILDFAAPPTDGIEPHVQFHEYAGDWNIEIDFLSKTNCGPNTWLKTPNRMSSQLQLWSAGGIKIISTNIDVISAAKLPMITTVSNAMQGVPWRRRAGQWLRSDQKQLKNGEFIFSKSFSLKSAFNIPVTNDYTLEVTPMLYKVDTNIDKAALVLFTPVKVRLLAHGGVINAK